MQSPPPSLSLHHTWGATVTKCKRNSYHIINTYACHYINKNIITLMYTCSPINFLAFGMRVSLFLKFASPLFTSVPIACLTVGTCHHEASHDTITRLINAFVSSLSDRFLGIKLSLVSSNNPFQSELALKVYNISVYSNLY